MEELGSYVYEMIDQIYSSTSANDDRMRKLRIVAEEMLKRLVRDHGVRISGNPAMMAFLFDKYPEAKKFEDDFKGFFRIANLAAHTLPYEVSPPELYSAIRVLAQVCCNFTNTLIPQKVLNLYLGQSIIDLRHRAVQQKEMTGKISAVIIYTKWKKVNGIVPDHIDLICRSDDEGEFTVRIYKTTPTPEGWRQPPRSLYHWAPFIPEYTRVNFFNLLRDPRNPSWYSLDYDKSMIVLEPDFLLEAKETGSIFDNEGTQPYYYLIEKLLPVESTASMFRGNIINNLLDKFITDEDIDPDEAFDNIVNSDLITAYTLRSELPVIKEKVMTEHLPKIKSNLKKISGEEEECSALTEPTFYSSEFGLTGRLDVLQISGKDPNRKNVIELKSGVVPKFGVWKNEEMQVTAYNMLLNSVYGNERRGVSSVFYSSAPHGQNFRNVPVMSKKSIEFLIGRNEIFLVLKLIRDNDDRIFKRLSKFDPSHFPNYKLKNVTRFRNAYNSATEIEKKYYRECVSFMFKELFDSKISANDSEGPDGSFAALWRQQPTIKEEFFYSLIRGLEFERVDEESGQFIFSRKILKTARFREGDQIILYPYTETLEPLKREILKGAIRSMSNQFIGLELYNEKLDPTIFTREKYFAIEPDFRDSNIINVVKSAFDFLEAVKEKKELLLGIREPALTEFPSPMVGGLEPSQREAVEKALIARDYYLLQGPPGTGKTSKVLMTIVRNILSDPSNGTVTILAFTNKAIMDVNSRLKGAGIDYLFSSSRDDDHASLRNLVRHHDLDSFGEYVRSLRVVTSTVASFVKHAEQLKPLFDFDTLIVDEASQLLEPSLAGILVKFKKFILIGDQNQLPAVTVQSESTTTIKIPELNELGFSDMKMSLFERMFNRAVAMGWKHAYGTLREQFRMDRSIMDLINSYYHGRLSCADSLKMPLELLYPVQSDSPLHRLLTSSRLIFIETPLVKTGKLNEDEANSVSILVQAMISSGATVDDIGIITPWRAQIAAINQQLEAAGITGIPVDTVERFQGSENRVIIYSTSVSTSYHVQKLSSIGSNKDEENVVEVDRKLNVVISRAKEQFIVLGSLPVLKTSLHYKRLAETIMERGVYITSRERHTIFGT